MAADSSVIRKVGGRIDFGSRTGTHKRLQFIDILGIEAGEIIFKWWHWRHGKIKLVILTVEFHPGAEGTEILQTGRPAGFFTTGLKCWEKQRSEEGNDGNGHHEFN
mgnify:CR=1 FL=1